jgi:catechol 2,3-dioxygenase-like lactoylglutathione lyase family enzyme
MIHGIHHTAISTPDLERALVFYRDLLGADVVTDFEWPAGMEVADQILGLRGSSARAVMLRLGNAMIELFEFSSPTPASGDPERPVCNHGITHLCLDVSDVDAEYERLRAAGMRFHCPPQDLGAVRTTYGRDPDGNVVELQEVTDPTSPVALTPPPA